MFTQIHKDFIIKAYTHLGNYLGNYKNNSLNDLLPRAKAENVWFDEENVSQALTQWQKMLSQDQVSQWINNYELVTISPKSIGIIMAGNIPLVGLHDMLCVWATGHRAIVKLSSDDTVLMQHILNEMVAYNPYFEANTEVVQRLNAADAIIATGSNNTNRYFEHYFGQKPHIFRKNRHSVAVIKGHETKEDFINLGHDIFQYYGLGCRSISQLLVPETYDFIPMLDAFNTFDYLQHNYKYFNNYEYYKAIYLINRDKHLDTGFLLIRENDSMAAPVGTIYFKTYKNDIEIDAYLKTNEADIQCIAGMNYTAFGQSQKPSIQDYADNIDTMEWLLKN